MITLRCIKNKMQRSVVRPALLCCTAAALALAPPAQPAAALIRDGDRFCLIAASADLAEFRDAVNAGNDGINARLTADIDLSENGAPSDWEPIGNPIYCGVFDGGGHTVSGYAVTKSVCEESNYGPIYYAGFFAKVGEEGKTAQIKNLLLRGGISAAAEGYLRVGGLAGLVYGDKDNWKSMISNCSHIGTVYGVSANKTASIGGLIGYNSGLVSDSFHSGDVFTSAENTKDARLGGLAGQNSYNLDIRNCGWQRGTGVGLNYASKGVYESGAEVAEVSADITALPIVTAFSVNIDDAVIDTDKAALVRLAAVPGTPNNVADYISNPRVIEDSYNHSIIKVTYNNDLTFSITPLAAGETPVTFTALLRATDFSSPDFAPVSSDMGQEVSVTLRVAVAEALAPRGIRVEPESADIAAGESLELQVLYENGDECGEAVIWSSGDASVACVNEEGTVTALSDGCAYITAYANDGRSARCLITVTDEREIPTVPPGVPPVPEVPVPPDVSNSSGGGGGCSAGFGAPLLAAALLILFIRRP